MIKSVILSGGLSALNFEGVRQYKLKFSSETYASEDDTILTKYWYKAA